MRTIPQHSALCCCWRAPGTCIMRTQPRNSALCCCWRAPGTCTKRTQPHHSAFCSWWRAPSTALCKRTQPHHSAHLLTLDSSRYLYHENSTSAVALQLHASSRYLHLENWITTFSLVLLLDSSRYLHLETEPQRSATFSCSTTPSTCIMSTQPQSNMLLSKNHCVSDFGAVFFLFTVGIKNILLLLYWPCSWDFRARDVVDNNLNTVRLPYFRGKELRGQ